MNSRIIKWFLVGIAGILSVMGLCFAMKCSMENIYGIGNEMYLFKKQLLSNIIGITMCIASAMIPWRKWLKLAPWGMILWGALAVLSFGFMLPHHGSYRWFNIGPVAININLVFVLVWALFTAWLCTKKSVKPWMIFAFIGIAFVFYGVLVFGNANRMARIVAALGNENLLFNGVNQEQMKAAYAAANWFGDADRSLRYLYMPHADAMPSAAALLFGKWFTLAAASLYAMLGCILTFLWVSFKNPSKKMFVLFWGGAMVGTALYSFAQSIGILPASGCTPALLGYGGSLAMTFWIGLGILLSILADNEECENVSRRKIIGICSTGGAFVICILLGMLIQECSGRKFHVPYVDQSRFGEFGIEPKRGEIYAADGSVLARSVKSYDIRLDPSIARKYNIAFNQDSLTNICSRLKLTPGELLNFCNIEKSRFILIRPNVEESVAKWFLSDKGRRLSRGFIIQKMQRREYPLGSNAVHVTGCIHHWTGKTTQGASEIEYKFNEALAGKNGEFAKYAGRAEQIARGKPIHGGSVTTTVVPSIQNILAESIFKAVTDNRAETAWGIVMNATNGAIAAMISMPTYNPEKTRDIKPGPDYFFNNAARMIFEPGSLMKPLTYAMALDKGLVTPETEIDHENGVWEYNGTKLYDVAGATGVLSVAKAFVMRTDIGAGKVGLMMWKDRNTENISRLGFGSKVGNETIYGEEAGILWPSNKYDNVTLTRLGLGRGLAVTGLQIANAYAAIANSGKTVTPHLVSKIVSTNGVTSFFEPKNPSVQIVSDKTSKTISSMMKEAMAAAAKEFAVDFGGVDVAGMISETKIPVRGVYSDTDYNVASAGFFPANNPKWVVVIGFTKPNPEHSAGRIALPVFSDVVRKIMSGENK